MTLVTYFLQRLPGYNPIYNARRCPSPVATNNDLGHYWGRARCEFMSFPSRNQFSLIELYRWYFSNKKCEAAIFRDDKSTQKKTKKLNSFVGRVSWYTISKKA